MKTRILVAVWLMVVGVAARGQQPVPPAASPAETTSGTDRYKYLTPWASRALIPGNPTAKMFGTLAKDSGRSRTYQISELIAKLKGDGLWSDLRYLQVFGASLQTSNNDFVLRGPRVTIPGTNYAPCLTKQDGVDVNCYIEGTCSNATLFVACSGDNRSTGGSEYNFVYLHDAAANSRVRLYASTANSVFGQVVGGGSQTFLLGTASAIDSVHAWTATYTLNTTNKGIVLYTNGISCVSNVFSHAIPTGMNVLSLCGARANYAMIGVWGRPLASNEVNQLEIDVRTTVFPADVNTVIDGDSILNITVSGITAWADYLFGRGSSLACSGNFYDISTGGHETVDVIAGLPATLLQYTTNATTRKIYIVMAGSNDLGNKTPAQITTSGIATNLQTIWKCAKTNGCYVGACTILNRAINGSRAADELSTLNTWIRSREGVDYDALIDMDNEFLIQVGNNYQTNTTYFTDGIHPNAAGEAGLRVMRDAVERAAQKLYP